MNTSSMIRIVISSLLMAIFSQTCPAQVAVEIKGTVRSVTGESLPGATVIVEGTARGSYYRCKKGGLLSRPEKDRC